MRSGIRAVAFDLMDTVLRDPYRDGLEAATGMPLRELLERKPPNAYPAFERGEITEHAYWSTYADVGIDVDPDAFHAARLAGYAWLPGMRDLVAELDGVVLRVAATNYPSWVDELTTAGLLAGCFDHVVASVHVGVRKPEPGFFAALLERLSLGPGEVFFVDDREVNVQAARAAGLPAVTFTGADDLRRALEAAGVRGA